MKTYNEVVEMLVEAGNSAMYGGSRGPFVDVDFDAYAYVLEVNADKLYKEVQAKYDEKYGPKLEDLLRTEEHMVEVTKRELNKVREMVKKGAKVGHMRQYVLDKYPSMLKKHQREVRKLKKQLAEKV